MKKTIIMILALFMLALVGCQAPATSPETTNVTEAPIATEATERAVESTSTTYPMTYTDGFGRVVIIEKEPQRIISIAPSITETIFALGAESKLVGRTDYCLYPEGTAAVESIGTLQEPNIEAIVALNPDLIIASNIFNEDTLKKLEELDLKVVIVTGHESFEGLYQIIADMGQIMNVETSATAKIEELKARVATTLEKVKGATRPSVYYVVAFGESGEYTGGGDTFIHQMIEMAGGDNIAKDVQGWTYSLEQIVEKDPEIIIVSNKWDAKKMFTTGENYKTLSAVESGHVMEVDEDLVQIQGPRLVDGLEAMVKAIHPELN